VEFRYLLMIIGLQNFNVWYGKKLHNPTFNRL